MSRRRVRKESRELSRKGFGTDRYDEIVGKLSPFLKGTGYNLKTDVTFIPVSGFTGANIKVAVDRKIAPWVE